MPPPGEDELSDEEDVGGDSGVQRKAKVRPELAQLEDEEELNLDVAEPERRSRQVDDYDDDEEEYTSSTVATVFNYAMPLVLAGPFFIWNVWRLCHWVCHRIISFPLDHIITPLETNVPLKKTVNRIGKVVKFIIRYGGIPVTLYYGWLVCPGVLKPNLLNIIFPWVPPYTEIQYELWIKNFYAQQARLPQGPGGNIMRTGTRAG